LRRLPSTMLVSTLLAAGALQGPLPARQTNTQRAAVRSPADCAFPTLSRRDLVGAMAGAGVAIAVPGAAFAESTLTTRQQAYTRYVPRIERGRDYWATGLRKAVASEDWATISAAVDKKGSIDRIFGPLELWASSWSSKTISEKTIAMGDAIRELREAADDLKIAAEGKATGGFLGFGAKSVDPAKRTALANAAYKKGVQAINKYIEVGNDGMGLQFQPIDGID